MAHYEDIIEYQDQVKCKLCSINLQKDDYLIEIHVKSASHRDLEVRRFLAKNSILINGANYYCNICNKKMGSHSLEEHLNCLHHDNSLKRIRGMVNTDGIFLRLPEDPTAEAITHGIFIYCVLCDRQFEFNIASVNTHINSDKHRRAKSIAIQPLNGIFSVEEDNNFLWCKFCRVYFENYIETIFEHVDEKDHKMKTKKILNLIKDQNISIEEFLMDPKEDKARCKKCNTVVACNVDNIGSHVKGKLHSTSQK